MWWTFFFFFFFCSSVVLVALMMYYGVGPSGVHSHAAFVPRAGLYSFSGNRSLALRLECAVSRRAVRDSFLTQLWLFATPLPIPVAYCLEPLRTLYGLNPMVGVVEGFRWALLGTETSRTDVAGILPASVIVLVTGFFGFRRMEVTFPTGYEAYG